MIGKKHDKQVVKLLDLLSTPSRRKGLAGVDVRIHKGI